MEPATLCLISSTIAIAAVGGCCYLYVKNKRETSTTSSESQDEPIQRPIPIQKPTKKIPVPTVTPSPNGSAKEAILSNINALVPLLDGVEDGTLDIDSWTIAIISINNEELISIWKKVRKELKNRPTLWLHLLSSWGISYDMCMQFVASEYKKNTYETVDGEVLIDGKEYKVIKGAWILTSVDGSKKLLCKGKAQIIEGK